MLAPSKDFVIPLIKTLVVVVVNLIKHIIIGIVIQFIDNYYLYIKLN